MPDTTNCPSRYASTEGTTAGAVVECRQTGRHIIHSNLADLTPDRVVWITGDDGELIRLGCDWCRMPGATHTADEHPLPKGHPDYDATDTDLAGMTSAALNDFWGNR
ncbi:hypothetical protein GCM10011608_09640 [Micromonospora sonchi]|uniref:Uncharacterized protein n=1 Tax=Micromonospora sonchi TaxID=1763543 RepID=A0A917WTL2_9ACTN|nr:hypothetical protein [Micromonospora sonchi]GGM26919.1 hypothetical protein GCM10011608_09640 [Micromonospora sonchi]